MLLCLIVVVLISGVWHVFSIEDNDRSTLQKTSKLRKPALSKIMLHQAGLTQRGHLVPEIASAQKTALSERTQREFPLAFDLLVDMHLAVKGGGRFKYIPNGDPSTPQIKELFAQANLPARLHAIFHDSLAAKMKSDGTVIFAKTPAALENTELRIKGFKLKKK